MKRDHYWDFLGIVCIDMKIPAISNLF